MSNNSTKRKVGLKGAVSIVGLIFLMFLTARFYPEIDLLVLLMMVSMFTTTVFMGYYRYGWKELLDDGVMPMIAGTYGVHLLMFTIGPMIALWTMSGTIPWIVWVSLKLLNVQIFPAAVFILCCVFSLITGTSWGTVAAFGVPLIAVARSLGIPLAPTAGAIVSGAYFGDKMSPIAATTLVASAVAEVGIGDHIKSMLFTTVPSVVLCLALYLYVGTQGAFVLKPAILSEMIGTLESTFRFNPLMLLPLFVVLYMIYKRYPSLQAFWVSMAVAAVLAVIQGHSPLDLLKAMSAGPDFKTGMVQVDAFLNRGGSELMAGTFGVVFFSYIFAGELEYTGTFRVLCDVLRDKFIKGSRGRYVFAVSLTGVLVACGTGGSFLGIVVPGMMYRAFGDILDVPRTVLSRTLEDTGTVLVPLVPWSSSGLYISRLLEVPTETYFPWAAFCYSGVLFSWVYCALGLFLRKIPRVGHSV